MAKSLPAWSPAPYPPQIVIDAGHGGRDPGKVGLNSIMEKDINLAIGLYLKDYLTASGLSVSMTRETDISLADPDASNQKLSDFKNRAELIRRMGPSAVISIHQNSYPHNNVHGAQVFYSASAKSPLLAACIQAQCRRILNPHNDRQTKENDSYYLFRHITCPIVIVECGFLSNQKEAALLITDEYQQRVAWAIHMGTSQFLKTLE